MSDTLQQLHDRKSARVFDATPVSPEVKLRVLAAALEAPTAGNMVLYTIVDITDPGLKERLAGLCDQQSFIAVAPMVAIFLADCHRWNATFGAGGLRPRTPGPGDLILACADAVIAAQNTVVAAHSLGLGSCYIGDILEHCEELRALLLLPPHVVPAAMLVYGYPTVQQLSRTKPTRPPLSSVVTENHYVERDGAHLLEAYAARGSAETLRQFYDRKYASEFAKEMNRSASVYLGDFGLAPR